MIIEPHPTSDYSESQFKLFALGKSLSGSTNTLAEHQKEMILNPNGLTEEANNSPLGKSQTGSFNRSEKIENSNMETGKVGSQVEQPKLIPLGKVYAGSTDSLVEHSKSNLNLSLEAESVRNQNKSSVVSHNMIYCQDSSKIDSELSVNQRSTLVKSGGTDLKSDENSKHEYLVKSKNVKLTPKIVKRRMVTRKEVKLKSPSNPRALHVFKRKETTPCKQRHLSNTNQNESSIVSKLKRHFERNQSESLINHEKISEKDLNCIKSGSVKNAFDLLMLNKGGDTPSKTPRKKCVKRLEKRQITSGQKKLDNWVGK